MQREFDKRERTANALKIGALLTSYDKCLLAGNLKLYFRKYIQETFTMTRKYKKKGVYQNWKKEDLCKAITECARDHSKNVIQVARKYAIPVSTLRRRIKKYKNLDITPDDIKIGRFRPTFTKEEEKLLKQYIIDMDKRMCGLQASDIRRIAFEFAESNKIAHRFNKETRIAGIDWYKDFMSRHPDLLQRFPEKTSLSRTNGFNKVNVAVFFDLLSRLMDQYKFSPCRIFNVDETGISVKQVGTVMSAERGELVTCVICCNAAGYFVPPLMIFPRKKRYPEFRIGCPPDSLLVFHPSGRIQSNIFCPIWFNHFIKFTKPSENNPILLILDNHVAHVKNVALIDAAKKSHVHILCLPPYTSHRLQPLDLTFMGPLKEFYSQQSTAWLRNHPGVTIKLKNIGELFGKAYMSAAVPQNAIAGFQSSGICPLDVNKFKEDFPESLTTDTDILPDGLKISNTPGTNSLSLNDKPTDCQTPVLLSNTVGDKAEINKLNVCDFFEIFKETDSKFRHNSSTNDPKEKNVAQSEIKQEMDCETDEQAEIDSSVLNEPQLSDNKIEFDVDDCFTAIIKEETDGPENSDEKEEENCVTVEIDENTVSSNDKTSRQSTIILEKDSKIENVKCTFCGNTLNIKLI